MEEETFQSLLWEDDDMETNGYSVRTIYSRPDTRLIEAIEKAVGKDKLYKPIGKSGTRPATYWEGEDDQQRIFKSFMEEGLDMDGILRSSLRNGYDKLVHQPLRLVRFLPNSANLGPKKVHPNPDSVSIFKPVGGDVGYKNGMFRIYPCSHPLQTKEEVLDTCRPTEIRLAADQVLIVLGSAWVELSTNGGGLVMWKGCSTRPVGMHNYSEHFLPFLKLHEGHADEEAVKGE
ncbi:hypothetical protein CNMCM5793_007722 [Aspergillus hiratsukae]|uniref:Uncharacterized protein n=1 Tax=Aspergillus hiratsukae TaxID=1194566 RepID=A0A8H6U9K2_9EURO|nr:hypothetical protein CNMCM5793_007722 [Aspergillus hiratsukae]KAF7159032.1 hypothetical protein CNMCM6106_006125 [Aspergillus hiratsukae]